MNESIAPEFEKARGIVSKKSPSGIRLNFTDDLACLNNSPPCKCSAYDMGEDCITWRKFHPESFSGEFKRLPYEGAFFVSASDAMDSKKAACHDQQKAGASSGNHQARTNNFPHARLFYLLE